MYNASFIKKTIFKHMDESKGTVSGDEFRAPCPAHTEVNPSFSINLSSGLFKCFSPECKFFNGGNIQHFVAVLDDISVVEAKTLLDDEYEVLNPSKKKSSSVFPYTQASLNERVEALLNNPEKLKFIRDKCLWTDDTIRNFSIGYSEDDNRYWIPIKENGEYINIRKYGPTVKTKMLNLTGFGGNVLFPEENMEGPEIYIMEGEKDCILANQLGLNAITNTSGAGAFNNSWKPMFSNKNVFICFDIDTAGVDASYKIANNLLHVAKAIKVISLPITEPKNGDFTDYILAGNTIQDFMALVDKTETLSPESDAVVKIPSEVTTVTLDKIDAKKLFYKRTKTNVRVIGTESAPFIIPRCMTVTCNKDNGKSCFTCRVGDKEGSDTIMVDETTPRILDLIECGTREKAAIIRDIFQIPTCKKYKFTEADHQSISRVSVIPAIDEIEYDEETQNQTYVERELYFVGKSLVANTDYEIETLTVPSPKDQSLVHLGYKVKYADTSVEEFAITPEIHKELEIFQCLSTTSSEKSTPT